VDTDQITSTLPSSTATSEALGVSGNDTSAGGQEELPLQLQKAELHLQLSTTTLSFDPPEIQIKVGDTVEWKNDAGNIHALVSGSDPDDPEMGKEFDSGLLMAGTFEYFCTLHSGQ
jgi:plastocyanin